MSNKEVMDEQKILTSFNKTFAKALAVKKALGRYAVVCDEKVQKVIGVSAQDLLKYPEKYKALKNSTLNARTLSG